MSSNSSKIQGFSGMFMGRENGLVHMLTRTLNDLYRMFSYYRGIATYWGRHKFKSQVTFLIDAIHPQ